MTTKYRVIRYLEGSRYLYKPQIWKIYWPFWVDINSNTLFDATGAEQQARLHYGVVVKELDMSQEEQAKFK